MQRTKRLQRQWKRQLILSAGSCRSEDEEEEYELARHRKEREVSEAFLGYLSSKGVFEDWNKNKETFQRVHVSLCQCAFS